MEYNIVAKEIAQKVFKDSGLPNIGKASIREIKKLVDNLENASKVKFVRMEMGIPGLPPAQKGVEAQIESLQKGIASLYPDIEGMPILKQEISRFVKNFIDIDVNPKNCIPTVGSMQGAFASFLTCSRVNKEKTTTLFIDPGFNVHKLQNKVLGIPMETFDVYEYRGEKLRDKLESIFKTGKIHSVLYSNPNNPSWVCFTDEELKIIGELATKYDVIIMEDLAYFGMDFRKDYSHPGVAPFQPSVAKYTDNYILLISSSKAFSYAGERIAMMVIGDKLAEREYPDLKRYYSSTKFGYTMIYGTIYPLSSGTSHSAQYALWGILKSVNDGEYNFRNDVIEYGKKAKLMKEAFIANGFEIVYDHDLGDPIADGFYFTYGYPGFGGAELLEEMLYYGISAISLDITGSTRQGIRACTSLIQREEIPVLAERLALFAKDHPINK